MLKKLASLALVIIAIVIAYEIFVTVKDLLDKGSSAVSLNDLILLVICLVLGAKLFHLLRS